MLCTRYFPFDKALVYRALICAAGFLMSPNSALAQATRPGQGPLWPLAQQACRQGADWIFKASFLPELHLAPMWYSTRGPLRALGIPKRYCPQSELTLGTDPVLLIAHIVDAETRESYFFVTSSHGRIIRVVRAVRSTTEPFSTADPMDPKVVAMFEREKAFWHNEFRISVKK